MDDAFLRLIGLARRARCAELGEDGVRGAIAAGRARAVFLAEDAGASIVRQAEHWTARRRIPLLRAPYGKAVLGASCGRASCAVFALTDTGFALSAAQKLPPCADPHRDEILETLRVSDARVRAGRRKKQRRTARRAQSRPPRRKKDSE